MSQKTSTERMQHGESFGRFDFMGISKYLSTISVIITLSSLLYIMVHGFTYGIDFAGGTEVQVQFEKPVDAGLVRKFTADQGFPNASVQSFEGQKEYLIRVDAIAGKDQKETTDLLNSTISKMTEGLKTSFTDEGAAIRRVDVVGPAVGDELKRNSLLAMFYSLILILIYVSFRFDYKFAPAAVFCLFHDAIVTLGIFAFINHEISVQTLAAVLTLIGYSLNDTIVIFDRVRENLHLYRDNTLTWIFNRSINETLSRTLLTNATTLLAVASLYVFTDGVIKDFAFTMFIGMVLGTYSTMYVASPLVILFDKLSGRKV